MSRVSLATVCSVLVDCGLHPFILMQSPELQHMVSSYVEDRAEASRSSAAARHNLRLINEVEPPEVKYVEVPKVLGDVFESLMGAIFIDSGHDLKTVWRVFRNLFPHLDDIVKDPPKNAKKELLERFPEAVQFTAVPPSPDKDTVTAVVTVTRNNKQLQFRGLGRNKVSAQLAACKIALKSIGK